MQPRLVFAPIGELHTVPHTSAARGSRMRLTGLIRNAGLVVEDGRVADVGSAPDVVARNPGTSPIPLPDALVTPGFVDCHTHLVWAGDRSSEFVRRCRGETYQDIADKGGGILSTVEATRSASVEQLADGVVARANLLLEMGTTTVEVKASYGLSRTATEKELDAIDRASSRLRQAVVKTFMGAHAVPSDRSREAYLSELVNEMIPMAQGRAQFNDVFCEVGAFTAEESRLILDRGLLAGLQPKIHADEFTSLGGTSVAIELGAASCDHLLAITDADIRLLANSETIAVTMPGTAFYLNKEYAPARHMIDAGCAVALASDFNPGSSQVPSMLFTMGLAVSRMGLSPEEALVAATANSAAAIKVQKGSLGTGCDADFCIWRCASLSELVSQFVFARPSQVYIGGERAI